MRNSYIDVLANKVEIPIIQRDYAQGRTDTKTNKIRKDFLSVIFDFIKNKYLHAPDKELDLDFIYGFNNVKSDGISFIPIDGQQRLTTFWLLYWFVGTKENIPFSEKSFLENFLYETRHSTTEFCSNIIQFSPKFDKADIVKEIVNQPWYFETWDYDPSVQAMLVVLKDIEHRYDELLIDNVWDLIAKKSCPFYFYKLDMESVGLTDDLYIKMNSRGKGLTDFEYFKAGFSEILIDDKSKERFENSIDQHWIDAIWHIVLASEQLEDDDDIALIVDDCFLNLFNFITSVIAFQKDIQTEDGIRYKDTEVSTDLLNVIYGDVYSQNTLFETLDAICVQQNNDSNFWLNTFYFNKSEFGSGKTRLYFQHQETSLLERCLFNFGGRAFTFPEQLLLHACLVQLKHKTLDFVQRIRVVRNLVINSSNELRETNLGYSFNEVENYIINGDLKIFKYFNTDQTDEQRSKEEFLKSQFAQLEIMNQLEDSNFLRGSISIFPLDLEFKNRAIKFLNIFDEDEIFIDGNYRSNLLLCFNNYTQEEGSLTNIMGSTKDTIRSFLTTPSYNKIDLHDKTKPVLLECLDFFISNKSVSPLDKIKQTLNDYKTEGKDWYYYFLKYPSFRENCNQGYYKWNNGDYCLLKLSKKQFNGYHWDPYLHEIFKRFDSPKLTLGDYGKDDKLTLVINRKKVLISSLPNAFVFENGMSHGSSNTLIDGLIADRIINKSGHLSIKQDEDGCDVEDRINKLFKTIEKIINR